MDQNALIVAVKMLWAHHAAKQFIYRAVVTTCPPQGTGSVTKQEDISPQEQGHRKFWDNTGSTPPPRSLLFLHGSTTTKLPGMHDLFHYYESHSVFLISLASNFRIITNC